MKGSFGATAGGVSVTVASALVVVLVVARHPAPAPARAATAEERLEAAALVREREAAWNEETARGFPGDRWSQRDDFHGRELARIVEIARAKGIRFEDVLRAVDEDLHRDPVVTPDAPDPRNARAVPCKPRPVYD